MRKILDKQAGPPGLTRYTAGDSKKAKPLKGGEVDYSRAKWTRDTTPKPTARWQAQPDSGVSIFADHPGYGSKR